MSRYGAERAAAEASAVKIHAVPYHFVGRNPFAAIAGMRQAGERQIECCIYFSMFHRGPHRVYFYGSAAGGLPYGKSSVHRIALLLDMAEVGSLAFGVPQAFLV